MRETPILHAVRRALATSGRCLVWRNNAGVDTAKGVRYGLGVGAPDLVGLLIPTGRFAAWEVKRPGGRLSAEQRAWHAAARKAGAFVAVVHSADEAIQALNRAIAGASE